MDKNEEPRLLGDIGGTNARFAWQTGANAPPTDTATYRCAEHVALSDAIRHYLDQHGKTVPRWCAIGIANPITGDQVKMTNHHWSFSIEALRTELGFEKLVVINDFTALALALPVLAPDDLRQIGHGKAVSGAPLAVLGAGTGLGVSGLLPARSGEWVPINGEGGHVTLAAGDERDAAILGILRARFGHVSAERALSGPGLVHLYDAVCAISGQSSKPITPAEIIAFARAGTDPQCDAAVDLFFAFLGSVAGDLALTLGARGGVYVGGGIVPRLPGRIEVSRFRERFEAKGRFRGYLIDIPTFVIDAALPPAFVGAARALESADGGRPQ